MPTVFFITHPDVAIDPSVPVPDWPLNERGRARLRATAAYPRARGVGRIFASSERKARDGAQILADGLGLSGYRVVDGLGENDRSATGYLPKQEFEATVDAFFAQPETSVRGWEPAVDAQVRIIGAVEQIVAQASDDGDLAIVGHGGTGTLLYCHLPACQSADVMISRRPMVETGSHSIGRAGNSCTPDGARSTRRYQRASRDHDGDSEIFRYRCLSVREFARPGQRSSDSRSETKIAPFRARAEWSAILVASAATAPVGVALGQTTPASPIVSDCRSPAGPSGYSSSAVSKPARSWSYCPAATASSR